MCFGDGQSTLTIKSDDPTKTPEKVAKDYGIPTAASTAPPKPVDPNDAALAAAKKGQLLSLLTRRGVGSTFLTGPGGTMDKRTDSSPY